MNSNANEQLVSLICLFGNDVVLNPAIHYPLPQFTLQTIEGGVRFGAKGNIMAVNGKAKVGKSFFITMLLASLLGSREFGMETLLKGDEKIVFLDTDQEQAYQMLMLERTARLLDVSKDELCQRLICLNARKKDAAQRMELVVMAMQYIQPAVIIIDNIAHLQPDWNDPRSSYETMNALKCMASQNQSLIVCVLHQNKGEQDNNMRGHLGTFLTQDASDVFSLTLEKTGERKVSHQFSRDMPVPDFCFRIVYNQEQGIALPELCRSQAEVQKELEKTQREEAERTERWTTFERLLKDKLPMAKKDLALAYQELRHIGRSKAYNDITTAIDETFLATDPEGNIMLNTEPF